MSSDYEATCEVRDAIQTLDDTLRSVVTALVRPTHRPITLPSGLRLNLAQVALIRPDYGGGEDGPVALITVAGCTYGAQVAGADREALLREWDAWQGECAREGGGAA